MLHRLLIASVSLLALVLLGFSPLGGAADDCAAACALLAADGITEDTATTADSAHEAQAHAEAPRVDGCETPCPGEDADGDCGVDCSLCFCCPTSASPPRALEPFSMHPVATVAPLAVPASRAALSDRSPRRLFRPPIPSRA